MNDLHNAMIVGLSSLIARKRFLCFRRFRLTLLSTFTSSLTGVTINLISVFLVSRGLCAKACRFSLACLGSEVMDIAVLPAVDAGNSDASLTGV